MRICIVTRGDLLPANHGAAVKIVRTAEYLSLQGAAVFAVSDDRDRYLRWDGGVRSEVAYSPRFRAAQEWPGVRRAGRFAEALCARVGYPPEEYFLYSAQFDPAWWARVMYVGSAERIDVFQAEFPGYGVPCWLAARALGRRSSVVQHNVEWDRLMDVCGMSAHQVRYARACEQFILDRVDEVIAVSDDDKRRMVEAGTDPGRITVIPHGVDTARYRDPRGLEVRFSYGIDADTPLLFFHGTLHYWPNTQAVAFIAEQLLPRIEPELPGVRVMITGMNPPEYYQHPAITFTGPVADIAGHIAAADLTLCPVFSGGGTRMKLLEYFAAGKACVSATKGAEGIRYTPGVELAVADDPDAFAAEVVRLARDPAARAAMGEAARRFVAGYDWTAVTARYLALYRGEGRGGDYNRELAVRTPPTALAPPEAPREGIEAHLPLREPSKPLTLLLLINRGCNLRCTFCDLWDRPENMPYERVLSLLDEAVAIGTRTLVITGGEPLIHPRIFDVIRAARDRGLGVNVTTNGTLVERKWDALVGSGVSSISMSLDGLEETHEALRGQKGSFGRTVKALRRLKDETEIALSVYFTVTNKNVHELAPVYELTRELGVGFDFWPVNDAPDLYLVEEAHKRRYAEAVAHIAAAEREVARRRHYYAQGLEYHAGVGGPVRCLGLVDQYGVTYEGTLLPCCVWGGDGLAVGNVFETPLRQLWRSPEVQRFRESMYGEGCDSGCFNHSLYEFTRSTGESFRVDW
jgi:MoaA/NifB/PqqE/SkfB family radical SAM enzyme/glycosyltransferase involved in cell wall biosynthesis